MTSFSACSVLGSRPVLVALLASLLGACASTPPLAPAVVTPLAPAALVPASGERVAFTWHAIGSQIYACKASATGGWSWALVAPEADLYNEKDEKVGTHGAGPLWAALDGSQTVGTPKAKANGAHANDIPLLLLTAKSNGTVGKMARVTSVQRLNTEGGAAPAKGCAELADVGKHIKEGYTADYVFFEAK